MPALFPLSVLRNIARDLGDNASGADFNEVNRLLYGLHLRSRNELPPITSSAGVPVIPQPGYDERLSPGIAEVLIGRLARMLNTFGYAEVEMSICGMTGHIFPSIERRRLADGTIVGPVYWDNGCRSCDSCNEGFTTDDLHSADDEDICEGCAAEHYVFCDNHGRYHRRDNLCSYLVEEAEEEEEEESQEPDDQEETSSIGYIRLAQDRAVQISVNMRATPWLYRDAKLYTQSEYPLNTVAPSDHAKLVIGYSTDVLHYRKGFLHAPAERLPEEPLWIGVELEVEPKRATTLRGAPGGLHSPNYIGLAHNATREFAVLKHDSSINSSGFEIVSIPATLAWHRTAWDRFFKEAASALYSWDTGRCGLHFHISRHALSTFTIGKASVFLNDEYNRPFIEKIAGRGANSYCAYYKKKVTDARIGAHLRNERNHHEALSVSNRNSGATLELRIFRGNVSRKGFMRSLDFTIALFDFAADASASKLGWADFKSWFVQPMNRSRYPFLARWAKTHGLIQYVGKLQPDQEAEAA